MNWIVAYLAVGFVGGYFVVRKNCESPAGTWIFFMFAGPLICAALAPFVAVGLVFEKLYDALGIEASESDTHGV